MSFVINPGLRKGIIIAIIIAVVFFAFAMVKVKTSDVISDQAFINDFVKWLKKKEGHASSDKDDTASSNAWPNGVHTYMGITKTTFENNSSRCGYPNTYNTFINMTPQIWWCNYQPYLQHGKQYSDNLILATYMSQWGWGSGSWDVGQRYGVNWKQRVTDILNHGISDREKLKELVALRKVYFEKNVAAIPINKKYLAGWEKKADEFYTNYSKYLAA